MSNGNFTPGTWMQLPSNCTRDYVLTYTRCSEYATILVTECLYWLPIVVQTCAQWAFQKAKQCISWANKTSKTCCTWWPCSWACAIVMVLVMVVCVLFAVVTTLVCVVVGFVLVFVCMIVAVVMYVVCLAWSLVEIVFCMSTTNGGTAFVLTDGTIMMQECQQVIASVTNATWPTYRWWKLSPDESGSYAHGKWTRLANSAMARKYFASAVLADGRVLVCGGEYSDKAGTITDSEDNTCEIYDPVADTWSPVPTPPLPGSSGAVWGTIGDAPCAVLPDGTFLLGSNDTPNVASLDPATLTWTAMSPRSPGRSDEESWVLMPDDTIAAPSCDSAPTTWVYHIGFDQWVNGNPLPANMSLVNVQSEIGPGLLRYDGTAFFIGATQHTASYDPAADPQWQSGPDLPMQDGRNIGVVDGPAVVLVNGNILFGAGPIDASGDWLSPSYYFEFDGTTFNRTSDPPARGTPTYRTRLLLLPNGDVLFCREDSGSFYAYHTDAAPLDSARPVIQDCPTVLTPGIPVDVSGLQFNGLSQAVAYGDDSQTATNYPLVRVTNTASGHVRYCRTFGHRTIDSTGNTVPSMGVATGNAVITTSVEIPADLELGESTLVVVANGIPSAAVNVTVALGLQ